MKKPADSSRTEQRSLVLSLLVHLVVFRYLVLVFVPGSVAHKPHFVFLGSFLEAHDVSSFDLKPTDPTQDLVSVPFEPSAAPFSLHDQSGQKPVYGIVDQHPKKVFLKTNFLQKDVPSDQDFLKNLGLDVQPKPYKHLKFRSP